MNIDVGQIVGLLALLGALAFLIEAVVEVAVASWLSWVIPDKVRDDKGADLRAVVLRLMASGGGVVLAIVYGLDLVGAVAATFGASVSYPAEAAIVGQVLTGLLMGRGAQWFHDVGTTWLGLDGAWPANRRML